MNQRPSVQTSGIENGMSPKVVEPEEEKKKMIPHRDLSLISCPFTPGKRRQRSMCGFSPFDFGLVTTRHETQAPLHGAARGSSCTGRLGVDFDRIEEPC